MSAQCLLLGALIIVLVAFCLRTSKGLVWGNLITYIYICNLGHFSFHILLFIILLVFILFYFSNHSIVFRFSCYWANFVNFIVFRAPSWKFRAKPSVLAHLQPKPAQQKPGPCPSPAAQASRAPCNAARTVRATRVR